jgi:hypothetical protein
VQERFEIDIGMGGVGMNTFVISCALADTGTVMLVIEFVIPLILIAGSTLLITVALLSILRDYPSRSDPPNRG